MKTIQIPTHIKGGMLVTTNAGYKQIFVGTPEEFADIKTKFSSYLWEEICDAQVHHIYLGTYVPKGE